MTIVYIIAFQVSLDGVETISKLLYIKPATPWCPQAGVQPLQQQVHLVSVLNKNLRGIFYVYHVFSELHLRSGHTLRLLASSWSEPC